MPREAIDQIFNRAQQGDVTAMALVGQMFLEGKYIQEERTEAIHFLREATKYNCLYARDLLQDELSKPFNPNGLQQQQQNNGGAVDNHDYMSELSGLIGLGTVKTKVESLRNLIKIQAMRAQQGLPNTNMSYHMVFTGNPGTVRQPLLVSLPVSTRRLAS